MKLQDVTRLLHYCVRAPRKLRSLSRLYWTTKFRSARRLARPDHAALPPPLITISLNSVCNLRCVQCWEWGDTGAYKNLDHATLTNELDLEQWERFFDQLTWRPYVYFFGGEPLLRKDLPQVVGAASRRGMLTALNSNMTLMTPEMARGIVDSGLD
jgi:MoaA/NifB/PqqE/SkfB family radical SAM enzyme